MEEAGGMGRIGRDGIGHVWTLRGADLDGLRTIIMRLEWEARTLLPGRGLIGTPDVIDVRVAYVQLLCRGHISNSKPWHILSTILQTSRQRGA